jgi:hypothetical protein
MASDNLLKIGDIVVCKHFANISKVVVEPSLLDKGHFRVNQANFSTFLEENAISRYVVEETHLEGGGRGISPGDDYPNGWHVFARKLGPNDTYDPKEQLIEFYQSGCFIFMIKEGIEVVGKMERYFRKIEQ